MELRYCEECGDVIRVESTAPLSPAQTFVCDKCKSGTSAAKRGPTTGQETLREVIQREGLSLFSDRTVALHKHKLESIRGAEEKNKSGRLRLVRPGSASAPTTSGSGSGSSLVATSPAPVGNGSAAPSKAAQRILFRCPHCRGTLSIRPVERTSKLLCPACKQEIFVTPSGRITKTSPSQAVRKRSETPPETGAASGPQPQRGSTVHLQPSGTERIAPPASQAPSPAVKPPSQVKPLSQVKTQSQVKLKSQVKFKSAVVPAPKSAPASTGSPSTVRVRSENPKSAPPATKPRSAFEEHMARKDPEKTAYITEEKTTDLSELASADVLKSVAENFETGAGAAARSESRAQAARGGVPTTDTDLLDEAAAMVRAGASRSASGTARTAPRDASGAKADVGEKDGITQRVLKALFSP